jgi:hypothetical protein
MRWLLGIRGRVIVEHLGGPPPVAALSDLGPDRRACHLRAMRGRHWRRLTVAHGHSNHVGSASTPLPLEEPDHTNRGVGRGLDRPVRGTADRSGFWLRRTERRRRPRPDGTGATPKASAGSSATSGPRASSRQRTATVTRVYHRGWSIASPGSPCKPWERSTRFHTIPLTTRRCAVHCPPGRPLAGSNGRSGPRPGR